MDILNLANWTVLDVQETRDDYRMTVEYQSEAVACSHCGTIDSFYRFGKVAQLVMDLPVHAKRVGLNIQRQRYKCKACGRTFVQALPDIDERRAATKRLIFYIETESLKRTFTGISHDVGVDEKTVRNIFREYIGSLESTVEFITPEWLGIDELTLMKRPRCIMTNVKERSVIELLETRNKPAVSARLRRLTDKQNITLVTMDMWQPYRDAVQAELPQAQIIVDKFHIQRMANQSLEVVRKQIRSGLTDRQRRTLMHDRFILLRRRQDLEPKDRFKLQTWTGNFPELASAYDLKESFFDVWEAQSAIEASERYDEWMSRIPAELQAAFKPVITAVTNWRQEIFAYFDYGGATNAYTEAVNGLAKLTNKIGRGYSFEAIRAKLLYGNGLKRQTRPKYPKGRKQDKNAKADTKSNVSADYVMDVERSIETSLGSDISTLIEQLQRGEF